jgi:ABC-type Fe3+/spermidine/putrescine transport system ATPase subunit
MPPFLRLSQLTKRFGTTTAVDNVSLDIQAGEIVCLLGSSGCGKTTLLRLIAGLEQLDSGEIWLEGQNIAPTPPHQRDFGLMFQDYALFPHKNVAQNIAFGLQVHGRDKTTTAARVQEMLALVHLTGYDERSIEQLSGGERQRVALARALAVRPRLLMLDEPLGALDRAMRERLMIELRVILKQVGVTAVYVTHDQTEAFAIADQIVVLDAGRIAQQGTPEAVYESPATVQVAHFLGFENVVQGVVLAGQAGGVDTAVGILHTTHPLPPAGQPVNLLLRPRAATIITTQPTQPVPNQLHGTLQAISFRGRYYQLWLHTPAQTFIFDMTQKPELPLGSPLTLHLSAAKIRPIA